MNKNDLGVNLLMCMKGAGTTCLTAMLPSTDSSDDENWVKAFRCYNTHSAQLSQGKSLRSKSHKTKDDLE